MGWKNWSYWLRGGIILGGIPLVLYLLTMAFVFVFPPLAQVFSLISSVFYLPYFLIVAGFELNFLSDGGFGFNIWGLILFFVFWFIIGAIIGLIIGKVKKRKMKNAEIYN